MKQLFGAHILETSLNLPEEERLTIISHILEKEKFCDVPKTWLCDLTTSYQIDSKLHESEDFSLLTLLIDNIAKQYAEYINFDFNLYTISMNSMWFNVYRKNQSQEKHDHGRAFLSCAFILEAPENCADFVFYNPLPEGLIGYPVCKENNLLLHSVKAETNKLLIFPGWLEHGVRLNTTTEPRISVSANWSIQPKQR